MTYKTQNQALRPSPQNIPNLCSPAPTSTFLSHSTFNPPHLPFAPDYQILDTHTQHHIQHSKPGPPALLTIIPNSLSPSSPPTFLSQSILTPPPLPFAPDHYISTQQIQKHILRTKPGPPASYTKYFQSPFHPFPTPSLLSHSRFSTLLL
jgi:hypothetical protein